ncbi:MAG: tRNA (guanosine(37)-N1)-methyltransferase TrmD [Gammaproteobacteria bacterium]|nr:MAG: tRNA (guanosine(37)-N1)-methyltransferase TrmD [Gammaproteobacteria bacterium]
MIKFAVISIFPQIFLTITECGVLSSAFAKKICDLRVFNPRDYAKNNRKTVDDRPYGGGAGMVMMIQPLMDALIDAKKYAERGTQVIYLDPKGDRFNQSIACDLAKINSMILVCGRYKGIDQRFIDNYVDKQISIGDYVLSGGELPAMVMIDTILRQIPGVLGNDLSAKSDTFSKMGKIDCPHYTRPANYMGLEVPNVLLSGDHAKIKKWQDTHSKK